MVGIGDGPWLQMNNFDDKLPARHFDNFNFVNFSLLKSQHSDISAFCLAALMEIPEQFHYIKKSLLSTGRYRELPIKRQEVLGPEFASKVFKKKKKQTEEKKQPKNIKNEEDDSD